MHDIVRLFNADPDKWQFDGLFAAYIGDEIRLTVLMDNTIPPASWRKTVTFTSGYRLHATYDLGDDELKEIQEAFREKHEAAVEEKKQKDANLLYEFNVRRPSRAREVICDLANIAEQRV